MGLRDVVGEGERGRVGRGAEKAAAVVGTARKRRGTGEEEEDEEEEDEDGGGRGRVGHVAIAEYTRLQPRGPSRAAVDARRFS